MAFKLWQTLNQREREFCPSDGSALPLRLGPVRAIIKDYGFGLEMQELVLDVDELATELMRKERQRRLKKKG